MNIRPQSRSKSDDLSTRTCHTATAANVSPAFDLSLSLVCWQSLADVFAAKAAGNTHVPFRNSKLTRLMEPCLSGSGKTLVYVTHLSWPELAGAGLSWPELA